MKQYVLFLAIFITSICAAQSSDETAIRKLLATQTDAWNRGNIDEFMETYWKSDSLMFIGKSGVTYGWNNTLKNYKKSYPDRDAMGVLSFDLLSLRQLSSEYFQVVGKWHLKRKIGDVSGHYTIMLKKINDRWVIISDHSS